MRKIILHYHFFKNAGTSIDEMLKANFPQKWVNKEFKNFKHRENISLVEKWIRAEKDAVAFSSHTAMLPPPIIEGIKIFPIIFIRHPIDRIASAYYFERNQEKESFGAKLARNTTLSGYIEVRLSLKHDRQCRNFHVAKLSQMFDGENDNEFSLAMRAIDTLSYVGLVENYDKSLKLLSKWLSPHFFNFRPINVAKNVTRSRCIKFKDKLEQIRNEIGESCYEQLLSANKDDLNLYEVLRKRYT